MSRGTTLENLVQMLRAECRSSTATSMGLDHQDYLKQVIRRTYEELYDNNDWPFMRITRENAGKTLAAGQRYYDFPVELNRDKPFKVWHKYNGVWLPLKQGIAPDEYTSYDSDSDDRSDPAQKWELYGGSQFEIWPLPSTNGGEIRFEGTRNFTRLNDSSDRADLDDVLITLFGAAEVLASKNQKDADIKQQKGNARLRALLGNTASSKRVVFGQQSDETPRGVQIRVVRTQN